MREEAVVDYADERGSVPGVVHSTQRGVMQVVDLARNEPRLDGQVRILVRYLSSSPGLLCHFSSAACSRV